MTKPPPDTEAIFLAALDVTPPERPRYIEAACAGNPELLQRVRELLQAHEDSQGPLDAPPAGLKGTSDLTTTREEPGTCIGPYKLLEPLGEGGMGEVFLADQEVPIRRQVALKIIKAGMDSARVLARFEQERQALALMDHANIAKVLDAGTTPGAPGGVRAGRPYFVMERVKGIPITRFCDQEQLTLRERLELFILVCQAVQHAHQKGIIHRDLKPSNVLVGLSDGKPVPKVIDFGVAKALHQKLTEHTLFTEVGCLVGTLEYMAPEQAEVNNLDIDTRADIYSLGVLLYELLTGSPPFTSRQLRGVAYDEMLRLIREVEPPRPSVRLSASRELPTLAARRQLEPKKLVRLVQGDLDWIVMKCLAKERSRRYETANSLALDLGRYLQDEPVLAGRPSPMYRLQKFARRHRGGVLAASIICLSLVGGIMGTTWGLLAERRARESAQKRLGQVEKANDILGSVFRDLDPTAEEKEGKSLRVVLGERLDRAVEQLDAEAIGDPLAVARMQTILADSLRGLGYYARAGQVLEKASAVQETLLGADHPDTLSSKADLAEVYREQGQYERAKPLFQEVIQARTAKLGADHLDILNNKNNLALLYQTRGRYADAEALFQEVLQARVAKLGSNDPATLISKSNLASLYWEKHKPEQAEPLLQEVLQAFEAKFGPDHPSTLLSKNNLAEVYRVQGKYTQAELLLQEVLPKRIAKLGPANPDTLITKNNLALVYQALGKQGRSILLGTFFGRCYSEAGQT